MSKKYFILLLLSAAVGGSLFLSSCKSTKNVTRLHLKSLSFEKLYTQMENRMPAFSWFDGKLAVNYQKGKKEPVSFRVQFRMKKDSIIWMSLIPAMGIEAARVVMTNDSVKLLNRLKKNYVLGTYHLLDSLMHTHINYAMIQALLFADVVHYPLIDSSATVTPDAYLLDMKMQIPATENQTHILEQKVWLNPETFRIKSLLISESSMKGKDIRIFYNEYQTVAGKTVPLKVEIVIQAKEKIVIHITYKKVETGVPHHFPFIVPAKYKKLI
jgi:hypothetical protein